MLFSVFIATILSLSQLAAVDLDRTKLEQLLQKKDTDSIEEAFLDNEEETLPFIFHYLESGLVAIEKNEPTTMSQANFAKALAFAKVADEAFPHGECMRVLLYEGYVNRVITWSPRQQKQFREAQAEYQKGCELLLSEPKTALGLFQKSQKTFLSLNDDWHEAMSISKIASASKALGEYESAIDAAGRSKRTNLAFSQESAAADDMLTLAECYAALKKSFECGGELYASAVQINSVKNDKRRAELSKRCREICERVGRKECANALKDKPASPSTKNSD